MTSPVEMFITFLRKTPIIGSAIIAAVNSKTICSIAVNEVIAKQTSAVKIFLLAKYSRYNCKRILYVLM